MYDIIDDIYGQAVNPIGSLGSEAVVQRVGDFCQRTVI